MPKKGGASNNGGAGPVTEADREAKRSKRLEKYQLNNAQYETAIFVDRAFNMVERMMLEAWDLTAGEYKWDAVYSGNFADAFTARHRVSELDRTQDHWEKQEQAGPLAGGGSAYPAGIFTLPTDSCVRGAPAAPEVREDPRDTIRSLKASGLDISVFF
jgi:hypothetical protein